MGDVFAAPASGMFRIHRPYSGAMPEPIREFVQTAEHLNCHYIYEKDRILDELLYGLKLKLHHFAADHVTQIVFPEPAESGEAVHQDFKAEIAPQSK